MAFHCCSHICDSYISLSNYNGRSRMISNGSLEYDWKACICCCTWTYCLCGETINERVDYCANILSDIDRLFEHIFCCGLFKEYQRQNIVVKLRILEEQHKHEIELFKLKKLEMVR